MPQNTKRSSWSRWWPFVFLCLLSAFRWSSVEAFLLSSTTLALGFGSAFLLAVTFATSRKEPALAAKEALGAAIAGGFMLCGPAIGFLSGPRTVDAASLTISLALVPVVIAVARPAFHRGDGGELAGRLWPGIAAIAALLLLLPQPLLDGIYRPALLAAAPLMTGIGAVWLRTRRGSAIWKAAWAFLLPTVLMSVLSFLHPNPLSHGVWLGALMDTLLAGLSVLTLFRVGGTRWSAQYEVVPLLVILESLFVIRPHLEARSISGIVLLALASVFLLLPPRAEEIVEMDGVSRS